MTESFIYENNMNQDQRLLSAAIQAYANYLETGNVSLSARQATLTNRTKMIRKLTEEQLQDVLRLYDLAAIITAEDIIPVDLNKLRRREPLALSDPTDDAESAEYILQVDALWVASYTEGEYLFYTTTPELSKAKVCTRLEAVFVQHTVRLEHQQPELSVIKCVPTLAAVVERSKGVGGTSPVETAQQPTEAANPPQDTPTTEYVLRTGTAPKWQYVVGLKGKTVHMTTNLAEATTYTHQEVATTVHAIGNIPRRKPLQLTVIEVHQAKHDEDHKPQPKTRRNKA
jgi:hypothetical protein